ncbi:PHB depolymerase family esterase [Sulfitobacter sp. S190]|uniref:alpha/beta hydrolase family esterase n=1 Tax=Sulfitobacter sp. S190 TaxID=2867022 RepID=UPI0021A4217E|nr:polyhydroxybutyrate depolymerase [Sulfitobacter sp. S190]UWR22800.1 polyhydroxybutyrate depolymerase [Sulfitobacter sp. S190]
MRLFLLLFAAVFLPAMGSSKAVCHADVPCTLGDRSYHVRAPDDWDAATPMPVLLHFHGWGRQGDLIVNHGRIAGHTRNRGVLLLAPNGLGRSWDFWRAGSRDTDFALAVIEDAAKRYPIDRSRIYVSGYSYGSAMAWRFACEGGDGVAALLAISGTIPQDETCASHPRDIRHVHGLADPVLEYPFGPGGDPRGAVRLWRDTLGCGAGETAPDYAIRPFLTLSRTVWDSCAAGGRVTLDTHPGGHFIPHGWIGWQLDQLAGRAPRYP